MALKPGDKYYTGLMLNFGDTLRRWAMQSSQQLHDSYKMQKVWNNSRSNSVWIKGGKRTVYKINRQNEHVGKQTYTGWTWYDESKLREKKDRGIDGNIKDSKGKYWYSTGASYMISQHNPVTVIDDTIESATVDFHTTMGALYAEAGVGANGLLPGTTKPKTRPRHIKVFRKDPWTHNKRYTSGGWKPGQGHAVRPNTRQQVSLLSRRLRWAAHLIYQHDLTIYLGYMLEQSFLELGKMVWSIDADGVPVGLHYDNNNADTPDKITWEEYLAKNRK